MQNTDGEETVMLVYEEFVNNMERNIELLRRFSEDIMKKENFHITRGRYV